MPLDKLEQLPDLVRLGLPADLLEIDQLEDCRMDLDVVASGDSDEAEPESLGQCASVRETEVVRGLKRTLKQLPRIHSRILPFPRS
jgi:hypothetical protein